MLERIKTFLKCFLVRKVKPKRRPSEGDVIGAFAFGFRKHGKPGKSNKHMARLAEMLHEKFCLPIISQWEIDKAMKRSSCHAVVAHSLHVWRVAKVLQKLGVETIIPVRLKTIPFDPKSEQWYTRNRFFWVAREIPARLYHFLKGWI